MSNTQPTEPIPPRQEPPVPAAGPAPTAEPFYKRHGLAFAISTLVLSIVVLIGIFTAGAFAVAGVVSRVGERMISHSVPHQVQPGVPGMPGMPGRPDDGSGGGMQQGQALVRGTIASISGDTWTIDRENGASVDVKVTTSTVYGTPGQSSSKSDFAAGDEVVVIGSRSDGALTAKRILKLDSFPTRPPSTPGPATPGS